MERELAERWRRVCIHGRSNRSGRPRGVHRRHSRSRLVAGLRLERGTIDDYLALARFHYKAERPATCVLVLRILDGRAGCIAAVLVVSRPTLHGPARRLAWPEMYEKRGDPREPEAIAALVNREVRTISRVVVDPRYRGLGLAAELVRAYLRRPLTRRTEAVSAMGIYCPLFKAAGMREVVGPAHKRDVRLGRVLRASGIPAWRLLEAERVPALLAEHAEVRGALRAWARAARPPRRLARARTATIAAAAGMALIARPRAYFAEAAGSRKPRVSPSESDRSEV